MTDSAHDARRSAETPLLQIEALRVTFGNLVAVRDVTFALGSGQLLGLIGPNGAGKTTLLRAIVGLQSLTAGAISLMGHRLSPRHPLSRTHLGLAPDNPPAYEGLTIRQFLRFVGQGYGLNRHEMNERIDFWLEQIWLKDKADQDIKGLSRGMRQRLGLARTLLPNPNVVLLDEPAAGLDPAGRVQFRQLLCNLRDQGKALIVSSHILADMDEYCTHIAIMAKGSLVQFGTVAEVSTDGDGSRCRYTMILTRPRADLGELLRTTEGVDDVTIDRQRATFSFRKEPEAARALLARLVHQEVPIAAFAPHRADLEEAYLRTGIEQVD